MSLVDKIVKRPSFSICGNRLGWITRFQVHMTHFATWWKVLSLTLTALPEDFLLCFTVCYMSI
nr:MAG TPA: hypothetical protein [Caudoviricetes sp.]DAY19390.1 MAG TPA: hypothetical protein [Caudoviricetes sp.]